MKTNVGLDLDCIAAFDWGKSIGRIRGLNTEPIGTAKGTGLIGDERTAFEQGLKVGYASAGSLLADVTG